MLSRSRGFTFGGALPIALDDMRFAFEVYGVPQHEWEYWVYLLQETDAVYLKRAADAQADKGEKG